MVLKHELKSNLKTFLIWTIIIGGVNFSFMLMYPSLQDALNEAVAAYENMGTFTVAFGMDRLSMSDPLGFYGVYIGTYLSLGGALFAAIMSSGILSKEEGGHTADFLFTLPYKRVNILVEKTLAVFIILLAFNIINLLLGLLSFPIIGADLYIKEILFYHTAQFFMHIQIAALGILFSAFMKKINLAGGLGIALLLYILDIMSRVLSQLEFTKYITPFYYSSAADIFIHQKIDLKLLAIGMVIATSSIIIGTWHYSRRDLAS